jgi:hypothetical protein
MIQLDTAGLEDFGFSHIPHRLHRFEDETHDAVATSIPLLLVAQG